MNLFNKLFGGSPPETEASKHLPVHPLSELPHEMNLVPLDELAAGEHNTASRSRRNRRRAHQPMRTQ